MDGSNARLGTTWISVTKSFTQRVVSQMGNPICFFSDVDDFWREHADFQLHRYFFRILYGTISSLYDSVLFNESSTFRFDCGRNSRLCSIFFIAQHDSTFAEQ